MDPRQLRQLTDTALAMRERAYAPYSKFLVGAAVLTELGNIYGGCNIENASFSLTLCAERVALSTAVANGDLQLVALAVATEGGAAPCGACLQFMAEFSADLPVLLINAMEPTRILETNLAELLPSQFVFRRKT